MYQKQWKLNFYCVHNAGFLPFGRSYNVDYFSQSFQERGGSNSFNHEALTLKYKLDNQFELVFVVSELFLKRKCGKETAFKCFAEIVLKNYFFSLSPYCFIVENCSIHLLSFGHSKELSQSLASPLIKIATPEIFFHS